MPKSAQKRHFCFKKNVARRSENIYFMFIDELNLLRRENNNQRYNYDEISY